MVAGVEGSFRAGNLTLLRFFLNLLQILPLFISHFDSCQIWSIIQSVQFLFLPIQWHDISFVVLKEVFEILCEDADLLTNPINLLFQFLPTLHPLLPLHFYDILYVFYFSAVDVFVVGWFYGGEVLGDLEEWVLGVIEVQHYFDTSFVEYFSIILDSSWLR